VLFAGCLGHGIFVTTVCWLGVQPAIVHTLSPATRADFPNIIPLGVETLHAHSWRKCFAVARDKERIYPLLTVRKGRISILRGGLKLIVIACQ
jgi:hypothetical protein